MKKLSPKFGLIFARKCVQAGSLFLFVYVLWSTTYPMKGVIRPETLFLADPNILIFTSVSERVFLPGLVWSAGVLVLILIFGRFFCGWICPLGTTIDAAGSCARNVKMPFPGKASKVRLIKYLVLGAVLIASLASFQAAWVCDPLVIMARFVSLNLIPAVTFAVDRTFSFVITEFHLYGGAYDLYRAWKSSFLGVKVYYFSNAGMILAFFLFSVLTAVLSARFWCRVICPLGAMYSLVSKFCGLRRVVVKCNGCGRCVKGCRMNAIRDDLSYDSGECILCMDCVYGCPEKGTKFVFGPYSRYLPEREGGTARTKGGISRKDFLFLVVSSIFFAGFGRKRRGSPPVSGLIRPPGALPENGFVNRCVRCGNCMKVCPTNVIQPAMLQAGMQGIWTPHLVPEIGYCEYNCTLCGEVCPTGAIRGLPPEKKKKLKIGLAGIDRSICIAWAYNMQCLVCEEHCPVPEKAIKISEAMVGGVLSRRPQVDPELCIGCGICQNKCPIRPVRAIKVSSIAIIVNGKS